MGTFYDTALEGVRRKISWQNHERSHKKQTHTPSLLFRIMPICIHTKPYVRISLKMSGAKQKHMWGRRERDGSEMRKKLDEFGTHALSVSALATGQSGAVQE